MTFDDEIIQTLKKPEIEIKEIKNIKFPDLFFLKQSHLTDLVTHRLKIHKENFFDSLGLEKFEPINFVSSESFYTYGIIINLNKGRLKSDSVYVLNTVDTSNSVLIKLNLEYCKGYSIFPGQVVAIRGKNVNGNEIIVEQIESLPSVNLNDDSGTSSLTIISANGPYLSNSFLDKIIEQQADVLILHGPFALSIEEFKNEIIPRLQNWLSLSISSKVILIPSLNDLISLNVLPQAPLDLFLKSNRILSFSNPSIFLIDNYLFATTSYDVFMDLLGSECFLSSENVNEEAKSASILFKENRITRLCLNLLFQSSFVPVYPCSVNVSLSRPSDFDIEVLPDFFILSSKMQHFVKKTQLSTIINHGSQQKIENKVFAKLVINGKENYDCSFHHVNEKKE